VHESRSGKRDSTIIETQTLVANAEVAGLLQPQSANRVMQAVETLFG
jgi:hypothetical protein